MADEVWSIDVQINVVGGPQVTNTTRALSSMTAAEQQNARATQQMNQTHQQATQSMGQMARQALLMGAGMAGTNAIIYQTGRALHAVIGEAIQFDAGLRNVQSITHITDAELRTLEGDLTNLVVSGESAGQSLSQLTDTQYLLASSGFNAQESLQLLNIAAVGAAAGQTDAATSGRVLAAVLNAYNLPVSQAQTVMDSLFQTVNLGVLSFEELAQFMGQVVPTAAQLGVGLDDLGAAIAVMTRAGIEPSNALTALNQAMVQFIDPSAEARKLMGELGIELSADAVRAKGFLGALQDIIPAIEGNDEAISVLFGNVRAMRAIMTLTTDSGAAYNQMTDEMAAGHVGAGATAEAFARQQQSVQFQLEELKVVGMALMAEALLPLLRDGVVPLAQAMGALYQIASPVIEAISGNEQVMRAFSSVVIGLVASKGILLIAGWLGTLGKSMIGYTAATEAGTAATLSFAAASRLIVPVAIAFGALTLWDHLKQDPAEELAAMATETNNLAAAEKELTAVEQQRADLDAVNRLTEAQDRYNAAKAEEARLQASAPEEPDWHEGLFERIFGNSQSELWGGGVEGAWADAWAAAQQEVTDATSALDAATAATENYQTATQKAATSQKELLDSLKATRDEALKLATVATPEEGLLRVQQAVVEQELRRQEGLGASANVDTLMALYAKQESIESELAGLAGSRDVAKSVADLFDIPGITPEQIRGALSGASGVLSPAQTGSLTGAVNVQPQINKIEVNITIPEGRGRSGEQILREVEANREAITDVILGSLNDAVERTANVLRNPW